MIKTKDLRLGNYLTDNSGFTMYVEGIYEDTVLLNFEGNEGDVFETNMDCLQPIKLTEELLLKCGFEKILGGIGWDKFIKDGVELSFAPLVGGGYIPVYRFNYDYIKIRFLHQLQNLFYTLTQKELEINL